MKKKQILVKISDSLQLIAKTINNLTDKTQKIEISLSDANNYIFDNSSNSLIAIDKVNVVNLNLLCGIENATNILLQNTKQFAQGYSANNALLWGARGMGKSSLIKSVHKEICKISSKNKKRLYLIEIHREDLASLSMLMRELVKIDAQFILFCDDLSFERNEASYKSLKTVLEGGLEGRAKNVLFYATSNRRHLMAREMIENESSSAINPSEAVEEKISLSDRFGISLGFHSCDQQTYLLMVQKYIEHYQIPIEEEELKAKAIEWSMIRGARSGRVAIQFVRNIAGLKGIAIN